MTRTKRAAMVLGSAAAGLLLFTASQARADAAAEAKEIFSTRCSTCHGPQGKGDGPAGAALNPKPRNLGDAAWQKSVTDDHIEKIIVGGGTAVGKSAMLPPNPDLASKPDVVKALTAQIRGFGGK